MSHKGDMISVVLIFFEIKGDYLGELIGGTIGSIMKYYWDYSDGSDYWDNSDL